MGCTARSRLERCLGVVQLPDLSRERVTLSRRLAKLTAQLPQRRRVLSSTHSIRLSQEALQISSAPCHKREKREQNFRKRISNQEV
eukprot:6181342-Pleurochrysis_carterae.AAC.6